MKWQRTSPRAQVLPARRRTLLAKEAVAYVKHLNRSHVVQQSGDSAVVVINNGLDGIEVLDCRVRRVAWVEAPRKRKATR